MNSIILNNNKLEYTIKRSFRARYMRLAVSSDASVIITLPWHTSESSADKFIREKASWLVRKIRQFKQRASLTMPGGSRSDYLKNKTAASAFIKDRLEHFNQFYNFKFAKISVRNQRTRWGSCSRKGNLNFNFKILSLPRHRADYIIVHELCHLKEFNHRKNFWNLIAQVIPEYKKIIKEMKGI